jgi:hypothetical protein
LLSEPAAGDPRMRDRDCWVLFHSAQVSATGGAMQTRVTLQPGEKEIKAPLAEHGHRFVCMRDRYDAAAGPARRPSG